MRKRKDSINKLNIVKTNYSQESWSFTDSNIQTPENRANEIDKEKTPLSAIFQLYHGDQF
jgi:hypothetical protein